MAVVSSSAMVSTIIPRASVWGIQSAFAAYAGVHSQSVSDLIQMLRLPRNAIVDQIVVGGTAGGPAAPGVWACGDDLSTARFGNVSISTLTNPVMAPLGRDFHYSMSDDDLEVTLGLTLVSVTSVCVSVSIHMQVLYHMP